MVRSVKREWEEEGEVESGIATRNAGLETSDFSFYPTYFPLLRNLLSNFLYVHTIVLQTLEKEGRAERGKQGTMIV